MKAISSHARSLGAIPAEAALIRKQADICEQRRIAFQEQQLRAFVVKHSVVRIHCVLACAMIFIAAEMVGLPRVLADQALLTALMCIATLAVIASTRTIVEALSHRQISRAPKAAVKPRPDKAGNSQVIVEFE